MKKQILFVMLGLGFVATNGLVMASEGEAEEKKCLREIVGWNDASDDKAEERELFYDNLRFNVAILSGDTKTQWEIFGKHLEKVVKLLDKIYPENKEYKERSRKQKLEQEELSHELLMHEIHENNYR